LPVRVMAMSCWILWRNCNGAREGFGKAVVSGVEGGWPSKADAGRLWSLQVCPPCTLSGESECRLGL